MDEPDVKLFGLQVVSQLLAVGLLRHEDEHSSWNKVREGKKKIGFRMPTRKCLILKNFLRLIEATTRQDVPRFNIW